jgi:hypothetical protein
MVISTKLIDVKKMEAALRKIPKPQYPNNTQIMPTAPLLRVRSSN